MSNVKSTDTLVALDIGTSKVLCLVADIDDKGELRIIGIGNEPCNGLNKGVISESVEVQAFTGLLTDFAKRVNASMLIRGLRAVSDFEYEFQMASANKRLHENLETVFLTASEKQHFVASKLVKEIARYGGDVSSFVPSIIEKELMLLFNK